MMQRSIKSSAILGDAAQAQFSYHRFDPSNQPTER